MAHGHRLVPKVFQLVLPQRFHQVKYIGAVCLFLFSLLVIAFLVYWARRNARKLRSVPHYWHNYGKDLRRAKLRKTRDFFDDAYPVSVEQRKALQELMNATCSDSEKAFRLVRCVRVENSSLWVRYRKARRRIRQNRGNCVYEGQGEPSIGEAASRIDPAELQMFLPDSLNRDTCEAYLWLGTRPEVALSVIHSGECYELMAELGTAGVEARFGEGWYFTDDLAKADLTAQAGEHLYSDCYAMLLCRVCLGKQQVVNQPPTLLVARRLALANEADSVPQSPCSEGSPVLPRKSDSAPVGSGYVGLCSNRSSRKTIAWTGVGTNGTNAVASTIPLTSIGSRVSALSTDAQILATRSFATSSKSVFTTFGGLFGRFAGAGQAQERPGRAEVYDSTLVEVGDDSREFIVYNSGQVYPEFAVVYSKCRPTQIETGLDPPTYWEHARALFRGTIFPGYWVHARRDPAAEFFDTYPGVMFTSTIQNLADSTWLNKRTRDRMRSDGMPIPKGDPYGDMPTGIRVLKVWRVECSEKWRRYHAFAEAVSRRRDLPCTELDIRSLKQLPWVARRRMDWQINETYLWHGSSPKAVQGIVNCGFDLGLSGSNVGAMFGQGVYFAECSSKADEYSRDDGGGYFGGCFALLLCRVILGEAQVLQKAEYQAHERVGENADFDSTVGDRESAVGTYREFVVPNQDQIYPEYAIVYERLYKTARLRSVQLSADEDSDSS